MSTDHKPNLISEKQRIYNAGSTINSEGRIDGNLNLSRSIGDLRYKKNPKLKPHEHSITAAPDIRSKELTPNVDFAVIGCDGIWEVWTSQQVVDFIYT